MTLVWHEGSILQFHRYPFTATFHDLPTERLSAYILSTRQGQHYKASSVLFRVPEPLISLSSISLPSPNIAFPPTCPPPLTTYPLTFEREAKNAKVSPRNPCLYLRARMH